MFSEKVLQDKIALITGGARGIGRATVEVLAQLGAAVTFIYNSSEQAAEDLVKELADNGLKVAAQKADVREFSQCEKVAEAIVDQYGQIDILVNNSGIVRDHLLAGLTDEDIKTVLDTNVIGVFNMSRACVPHMMRKRQGKIINISSVSAEKGGRGQTNYAASKGAINALTKSMAVELARRNIRVNAVAPGIIETDMSKEVRDLAPEETLSKILLKRYGQPMDIAYTVAFLASSFADYITGEIIHVDGGFKMD